MVERSAVNRLVASSNLAWGVNLTAIYNTQKRLKLRSNWYHLGMKTYDWIVVSGGITGAALSYELAKVGLSVLLVEQYASPQNATRYSYGGIAY